MPNFIYDCAVRAIVSGEPAPLPTNVDADSWLNVLAEGGELECNVHYSCDAGMSEPVTPASSVLPPGSICEDCFDALATRLAPAPWGGEMGICAMCPRDKGIEAEDTETPGLTLGEALERAETFIADAMRRHLPTMIAVNEALAPRTGLFFGEAHEAFRRLGDVLRTFPPGILDDLVIHPSR